MPKISSKSLGGIKKYDLNKNNLEQARKREIKSKIPPKKKVVDRNIQRKVDQLARSMGPVDPFSLLSKISPFEDWMYVLALFAALIKDILDLCIFLFGIGDIIPLLASLIIDPFIFMMMILGSSTGGRGRAEQSMAKSTIKQSITILVGSVADDTPGLNILPIETVVVLIVYVMTLSDRVKNDRLEKAYRQLGV